MNPFSYKHSFTFDERLFVELNSLFMKKSRPLRLAFFSLFGVACLFWSYTVLIGFMIICVTFLTLFSMKKIPSTLANTFHKTDYLQHELTYKISEKEIQVDGKDISAKVNWNQIEVWDEKNGWFRLTANNIPSFWFKIEDLKANNIYNEVLELSKKHATKFKR